MTIQTVSRTRRVIGSLLLVAMISASLIAVAGSSPTPVEGAIADDETVYVVCDSVGSVEDVVVVDWLRVIGEGETVVTDHGDVTGVEAIKDNEEPVIEGDKITWTLDVDGKRDFFYRAETDQELPLDVDVTYTLDGREVEPAEVAGATGHLRIDVEITNRLKIVEDITYEDADGVVQTEKTEYWVPMLAPVVIDVDGTKFSNIEGDAEIVSVTGSTVSHTFMAFPQPDATVTIEMDGEDIAIKPIIVSAFPKMAGSPDFSQVEQLDEMRVGIEGLALLTSGQMEVLTLLADEVDPEQYGDVADQIAMFDELIAGVGELSEGADGLVVLVDGQIQYLDGVIAGLEAQDYDQIAQLPSALATMTAQIEATKTGLDGVIALLDGQRAYLDGISLSNAGIEAQTRAYGTATGDATVTAIADQLAGQQVMIDALRSGDASAGLPYGLDYTSAQLSGISYGLGQIASAMGTITAESAPLATFPAEMDALVASLKALRDGGVVQGQPLPGLVTTKAGLEGVAFGLAELDAGLSGSADDLAMLAELPAAFSELQTTLLALRDGGTVQGQELPGLSTTEEALTEISDVLGETVSEASYGEATVEALEDAAEEYDTFLGTPDTVEEADVRFLYKLDGIGE
jgi:putative membrane protein